jgi:hypothetical protein
MFLYLFLETIILIFAILAGNWFFYSFIYISFNKYFSVLINNFKKKIFVITFLIGSNPLRLTSSESNVSQTLLSSSDSDLAETLLNSSDSGLSQTLLSSSGSSSNLSQTLLSSSGSSSNLSQTFVSSSGSSSNLSQILLNPSGSSSSLYQSTSATSLTSSNTSVYEGILTPNNWFNLSLEQVEAILTPTLTSNMETLIKVEFTSMDSVTMLNSQSYNEWRELVLDLHQHPINTPAGILRQIKFEELNILYREDLIEFAITQAELRLLIEMLPAMRLFEPDINHLILTMMSYY